MRLWSVSELAERFCISRKAAHEWISRFRDSGERGYTEHSRRRVFRTRNSTNLCLSDLITQHSHLEIIFLTYEEARLIIYTCHVTRVNDFSLPFLAQKVSMNTWRREISAKSEFFEGGVKQPTQKEVAEKAGVSRATVSYVLNGKSSETVPISDETRRKVLGAAEDLGYSPNAQARTLRSGRTMTIGVLMLDLHNPHFWQQLSGIELEAHQHGYTIMVFHTALKQSEENVALRELTQKRIDGAIINASYGLQAGDRENTLKLSGMPIVDLSTQDLPFDRILADYRAATKDLVNYLHDQGHRKYGLVYGVANPENGLDRLEPYRDVLRQHGVAAEDAQVEICEPTQDGGYEAAIKLLKRPNRPTAIVAINDFLAVSVLRAAADLGISVPDELSVCGYDDIPTSRFSIPRLTTVRRDTEKAGALAFRLLLDRMNGHRGPRRTEWIGASLQIRESTGPAPTG